MKLSRGQIVGLITIGFLFAVIALAFQSIMKYANNKIDYLTYDKTAPNISVNGSFVEYTSLGHPYLEKGLNSKKKLAINYFKDGRQVANIDTSKYGTYEVRYYLKGRNYISRTVIVIDDKAPVITVPDKMIISPDEVDTFDLKKDVIVTDNSNESTLTYDNTLSKNPGSYIITYEATDSSGNKSFKKRLIEVKY